MCMFTLLMYHHVMARLGNRQSPNVQLPCRLCLTLRSLLAYLGKNNAFTRLARVCACVSANQ